MELGDLRVPVRRFSDRRSLHLPWYSWHWFVLDSVLPATEVCRADAAAPALRATSGSSENRRRLVEAEGHWRALTMEREVYAWCSMKPGSRFTIIFKQTGEEWMAGYTFPLPSASMLQQEGARIRIVLTEVYVGCPHCGTKDVFLCGGCGALNCLEPSAPARWWLDGTVPVQGRSDGRTATCGSCRIECVIEGTFRELSATDR